jgi:Ni,Fe-hydrogenase III large subunit
MTTNNDLAQQIGYLTGIVESLEKAIAAKDEHESSARRAIYERIEGMGKDVTAVAADVKTLKTETVPAITARIDEKVMPSVRDMEGIKRVGMGTIGAAGVVGASLFAIATQNWGSIWGWIVGFFKGL